MGRPVIPSFEQIGQYGYFRRRWRDEEGKRVTQRIPLGRVDAPDCAERLASAQRPTEERSKAAPGSIAALIAEFRPVLAKRKIAPSTRRNYAEYIDRIEAEHGHRSVAGMRPAHLYKIRDGMADTPGAARVYMAVMRLLMAFACERDWRADNPAAGIPALPIGEHEPWPAAILEAALERASPRLRLAIVTGLTTRQRIGDCIRIQHAWIKDGIVELVQEKTGKDTAFPAHPMWLEEIARLPRRSLTVLYDRTGQPYAIVEPIQAAIRRLMTDIGCEESYSFHGLRKNACCYLLELGLNDAQVGSLLGMSASTVRHYGKRARALMVAREAADKVTGAQILPIKSGAGAK